MRNCPVGDPVRGGDGDAFARARVTTPTRGSRSRREGSEAGNRGGVAAGNSVGGGGEHGVHGGVDGRPGYGRLGSYSDGELGFGHGDCAAEPGRGSVSLDRSQPTMSTREDRRSQHKGRNRVLTARVPSSRIGSRRSGSGTGATVSRQGTAPVSGVRTGARRCRRTRFASGLMRSHHAGDIRHARVIAHAFARAANQRTPA